MSIQLFSCAPLSFFENCEGIDPLSFSREFVGTIKSETGIDIPIESPLEGMMEDLWISEYIKIDETLRRLGMKELSSDLGGDLCIPSGETFRKKITFSWSWYSGDSTPIYTVSTRVFRDTMIEVEPIIIENLKDHAVPLSHFDLFRQAIDFSEKNRFPILWSI
jgi:hypothetical protein